MGFKVTFLPDNIVAEAQRGATILQTALECGVYIDSPCGGGGSCGNCRVFLQEDGAEREVLACETGVTRDMTVRVPGMGNHKILESGLLAGFELGSIITRNSGGMVFCDGEPLGDSDPNRPIYAMAFDIGTTTVVGYLLNIRTGREGAVVSMLNPQSKYGADVISRSNYAIEHGVEPLSETIRDALRALITEAVDKAAIQREQIFLVSVVGNTCMHHLFLGISPASLVVAPYLPAETAARLEPAAGIDLGVNPGAVLMVLPNIAGFVGADTVGAVLATNMDMEEPLTLLIDIGTNGEMALGNKDGICACSTAAGPAFEGALISCGMRGTTGAVDHAKFSGGEMSISVIDGGKPKGVCGSGLIDIIAGLVKQGVIDETGRLLKPDEVEGDSAKKLASRVLDKDGLRVFMLTDELWITQKDVREIQLAKAAMASGVDMLMSRRGVDAKQVDRVMLAGAFGNYMSPESACGIGLIPAQLQEKIIPVGNAAGMGAKAAALSRKAYIHACRIGRTSDYLELAGMPEFQDVFVDNIVF